MEPPGAKRPGVKVVEGRVLEVAVQVDVYPTGHSVGVRVPQSAQSVPIGQMDADDPAPPSWQTPFAVSEPPTELTHVLRQMARGIATKQDVSSWQRVVPLG